jgi:hypothetical protein
VDVHIPLNVEKRLASRLYCCILLLDKIETTILYLHNEIFETNETNEKL